MSIKRHPALQPFSRDHLIGLFHAQKLKKLQSSVTSELLEDTIETFSQAWEREILIHFADEDRILGTLPIKYTSIDRLNKEHEELTALVETLFRSPYSAINAVQVGTMLDNHIRWEEHELFPEVESSLSPEELIQLEMDTGLVEKSRKRKL